MSKVFQFAFDSLGKPRRAMEQAMDLIDESLVPLVFRRLDERGWPRLRDEFSFEVLPRTAARLCKFAGVLLQAYWCLLKQKGREDEIPNEVDSLILQIWGGHWQYSDGTAISLLRNACMAPPGSTINKLVSSPATFELWGDMFRYRLGRYKEVKNVSRKADWYEQFSRLLDSLPILHSTTFVNGTFNFQDLAVPIPTFPFLHRPPNQKYHWFLYSFEHLQSRTTVIYRDPYSNQTEELCLEDKADLRDEFNATRQALGLEQVQRGYVHLFGDGYRHIENLALALASVGGEKVRNYSDEYRSKQPFVPEGLSLEDLITLAMADSGPSEVLKELLGTEKDPPLRDRCLDYFERLGVGGQTKAYWLGILEQQRQRKEANVRAYLEIDETLKRRVLESVYQETSCWCLLNAAGLRTDTPSDYVESIGMRIRMLQHLISQWGNRRADLGTAGNRAAQLVERTLKFLICFYSGFEAYYESYKAEIDCDNHEAKMSEKAKRTFNRVKTNPPGALVKELGRLFEQLENTDAVSTLLGRSRVLDLKVFRELVGRRDREKWDDRWDDTSWVGVLNRIKHDKTNPFDETNPPRPVSAPEMTKFLDTTSQLLKFFKNGKHLTSGQETLGIVGDPVYPKVVSFREQHRKKDGFSIYNYKVYSLDGVIVEDSNDVKILTSRERMSNEEYYCIPSERKTTNQWWLDPFLVRCGRFHGLTGEHLEK